MVQGGRFSTHELASLEQRVISRALRERAVGAGAADLTAVDRALAARPTIGADQAEMVRRLCGDGDRVQVVIGPPGTGKTFALDAAREAWEGWGYTVVGAAVARRAARRIEVSAGIRSTSVAALQRELRIGGEYALGPKTVVVVDEAGMLGTRDLHELVEHASGASAKVVLVGDHKQLPEIDAGGTFRALAIRTDPIVLTENRRQRDEWARRMVKLIRDGDVREGLELASDRGAIVVGPTAEAAQAQLVREWWRATEGGANTMMIAYRRAEVRDLNAAARALMDDAGGLGRDRLELPGGEFAAGDRVLLKRGSTALDVDNGEAGIVERVDVTQERLIVRVGEAGDRVVTLPRKYLNADGVGEQPSLVHGYAATGHVHQGATADRTFVLGSPGLYREWITTAASRPRDQLRFYLADPDCERQLDFHAGDQILPDAFEDFGLQAERSQAQTGALDTIHREDLATMPADELRAEMDRLEGIVRHAPGALVKRQLASAEADLADAQRTAHQATARRCDLERTVTERDPQPIDVEVDFARARAIEADAHVGVGEAAERVHELRMTLAADRWPETHANDLARYAAARDELSCRQRTRVMQVRHVEVPDYLVAELGDRPSEPKQRGVWDRAAVRIEHYRVSFGVTDSSSGLGERPRELRARSAYDLARRDVDAARNRLARDHTRGHARGGLTAPPPPGQQTLGFGR